MLISACSGHSLPDGAQLAEIPDMPIGIQPAGGVLVLQTQGGDALDKSGPANGVYSLATKGGELHMLGTLRTGWMTVAGGVAYYVTTLGGDVYAMKINNGAPQHVAQHVVDTANGIAAFDGGLLVIGRVGNGRPDRAFRIDLTSGTVSPVTLPANSATTSPLQRWSSASATLLSDELNGTTLRVDPQGAISVIAAPPGAIECVATTATQVWWFRQTLGDGSVPELYAAPLAGGTPVHIADTRTAGEKSVGCAANARDMFYSKGRQIFERPEQGEARAIATMNGELGELSADDNALYWSEKLPSGKWSIRTLPVH
ncbi:MAG: hypothetical protein ABI467_25275 [Kofleriaceae bacterium]